MKKIGVLFTLFITFFVFSFTEGNALEQTKNDRLKVSATNLKEIEPNNNIDNAQALKAGDVYVDSELGLDDTIDYYKITAKKSGYVSFTVATSNTRVSIEMMNAYGDIVDEVKNSFANETAVLTVGNYVEAGTYYVQIKSDYDSGKYKVKANVNPANNTEKEPNNSFMNAQLLQPNKGRIMGLISWNETVDYYKVVVPKKTTVKIATWTYFNLLNVSIYNSDFKLLHDMGKLWANENVGNFEQVLPKGTYYVRFRHNSNSGKYEFSVKVNLNLNPSLSVNAVTEQKKKISGKTEANAKVGIYVNNKRVKTTTANSSGNYSYTYKKLKAKNKVKVISTNKYGGKTTKQVTVQSVKKK